jgi:hypothetical protein
VRRWFEHKRLVLLRIGSGSNERNMRPQRRFLLNLRPTPIFSNLEALILSCSSLRGLSVKVSIYLVRNVSGL